MKDFVLELASKKEGLGLKINIIREYLQAYTLRILFDMGIFRSMAFVGGTALRFLHDLPRYSEDLDFSYERKDNKYSFEKTLKKIKNEFISAGYNIEITYKDKNIVQSAFLKFPGLLYEAGVSNMPGQKLSIKMEIDTNPPKGAQLKTEIVNKFFPISYLSYDISSLFAGKLHALLNRKFTKGRDLFDLGWYLSKWKTITPNIKQLNAALDQTGYKGEKLTEDNWRKLIFQSVSKIDWKIVRKDVESFLEKPSDLKVFTKENILSLLSNKSFHA